MKRAVPVGTGGCGYATWEADQSARAAGLGLGADGELHLPLQHLGQLIPGWLWRCPFPIGRGVLDQRDHPRASGDQPDQHAVAARVGERLAAAASALAECPPPPPALPARATGPMTHLVPYQTTFALLR
jgi:hypothetical protein